MTVSPIPSRFYLETPSFFIELDNSNEFLGNVREYL
jgi:hypothetical protein